MKRRFISPIEVAETFTPSIDAVVSTASLREQSPVDQFYCEECIAPDDSSPAVCIADPIYILFNQQRLDNMGQMAAKEFIDSLIPRSNDLAQLRAKCSDDDLMSMIKSRHLQSPAEILHWCRYINENVDKFNSEVAKLQAEQAAQQNTVTEATSQTSE